MDITGFILASGEGSRMTSLTAKLGLPKHLLPLGNSTVTGRTIAQLNECCDQVTVIVKETESNQFQTELTKSGCKFTIATKKKAGFQGDFAAALSATQHSHAILTVGDLVFPDNAIVQFVKLASKTPDKLTLALDRDGLRKLRFPTVVDLRMVLVWLPREILAEIVDLNPENFWAVSYLLVRLLTRNKVQLCRVATLFNINRPENYLAAKNYFDASK
jgi:CTP:molybdopterin cytidylyltransferase MocA